MATTKELLDTTRAKEYASRDKHEQEYREIVGALMDVAAELVQDAPPAHEVHIFSRETEYNSLWKPMVWLKWRFGDWDNYEVSRFAQTIYLEIQFMSRDSQYNMYGARVPVVEIWRNTNNWEQKFTHVFAKFAFSRDKGDYIEHLESNETIVAALKEQIALATKEAAVWS